MARESEALGEGGQSAGKLAEDTSNGSADGAAAAAAAAAAAMDADKDLVAGIEPPSARVTLSEARIVAAALDYIDKFGLPGLSMRRLGSVLERPGGWQSAEVFAA